MGYGIVVVGTSWGGTSALRTIMPGFSPGFPLPVAVVQHRDAGSRDEDVADLLRRICPLPVQVAEDKDAIVGGHLYIAPSGYHLLVENGTFSLSVDDEVQYSRPSVNVLFESAADAYGAQVIGIVLTGGGKDGAAGIAAIKRQGGVTIVQD